MRFALPASSPIWFELKKIPFRLENDQTPARNAPETMPGGVAVFDYNGDGRPDIFFTNGANISTLKKDSPKYRNKLFRNEGNGVFTDVTDAAGLAGSGYDMGVAVADYDNDGHPDLFVAGLHHSTLYHNNGDGTFQDVSKEWGIRAHVGKGMGVGMADYDLDGRPDLFVTNDASYNSLFHNVGNRFEEVAFETGVALTEDGSFISGMGLDFRDFNNDGYPDIAFVALNNQTFPVFRNTGKGDFREVTTESGMRDPSRQMSGFGAALYDFDNDGWKDLFVSRGHVESLNQPGQPVDQPNTVFRNVGASGKWVPLTEEAGFQSVPPARHRGCAFGDLDGDGRVDVVVSALGNDAEIWMNRSAKSGHWLDVALRGTKSNRDGIGARIKLVTRSGAQFNHMTTSVGYASSSDGPVHFGLGAENRADLVEIHWPSGIVQILQNVSADQVLKVTEPAR